MPSLRNIAGLLLLSLSVCDAKVEFTHSTLYGIYDFIGVDEVPLPNCDFGCFIYTSTYGDLEDYMMNLVLYDPSLDQNRTLANLGLKFDPDTSQKIPLDIAVNGSYSIYNLNAANETGTEITVWVVEREKALEVNYEIYDALELSMKRGNTVPKDVVTIMSVTKFRVVAKPGEANSYTARLTGFDNAFQDNPDLCVHACQTPLNSDFNGFELHIDGPLVSFVFANKKKVDMTADYRYAVSGYRDMSKEGFIATSGYSLCERLGGEQIHRARFYQSGDEQELVGEPDFYQVYLDTHMDLDEDHQLNVTDQTTGQMIPLVCNRTNIQMTLERTQHVVFDYIGLTAPQTFLIRHNAILKEKATTTAPTTGKLKTIPTSLPTTSLTTPKTSTAPPPSTTSAAGGVTVLAAFGALLMILLAH